jgi:site-specific DNA-methyltransferase (adenine-specific)
MEMTALNKISSPDFSITTHSFEGGTLFHGDNLLLLQRLQEREYRKEYFRNRLIRLIYIDPPFDTRTKHKVRDIAVSGKNRLTSTVAFDDSWGGISNYISMLRERIILMRDILSEDGSFYLHCDWRTNAHIRLLLDEIFCPKNFQNEIIWSYRSGGSSSVRFSRKHDSIFFYSKSKEYLFRALKEKSYNRGFKPYRFKGVEEFQDEKGWYTVVNMRDVWELDMVGRSSNERNGYPTQKPEKLLERIISASSDEGDLVADFFSGSGTTLAVADKLKRNWVGCDQSIEAIDISCRRILQK